MSARDVEARGEARLDAAGPAAREERDAALAETLGRRIFLMEAPCRIDADICVDSARASWGPEHLRARRAEDFGRARGGERVSAAL
ncbi:MAG: hypothetical protein OZ928_12645 [Polyangiaceae bacterium]|nr:hypothetical protein [Polyangiaceae bacterium]